MQRNVKFSPVTMATGNSERKLGSGESFDRTRSNFLHNPGVPVSTEEERMMMHQMGTNDDSKAKKRKSKKRREKTESLDPNETEDSETRRLRELQECILQGENNKNLYERLKPVMLRHMRMLDDLTKVRNHYYSVYMEKLNDQVEEQRREIQRRTDQLNRRILLKELKQKKESHRVKKRHQKSQLNHDNTFLLNLQRTRLHQIVCLEEKMAREGKFRTIEDLERFWSDVEDPETFRTMVEGGESRPDEEDAETSVGSQEDALSQPSLCNSASSSLASLHPGDLPTDAFTRGLSQIYEDSEPGTRPATKAGDSHSWAVTKLKKEKSRRVSQKNVPPSVREQDQDPALQLSKVEFPQLACFTMNLDPAKEDPEAASMREEYRWRARLRDQDRRKFRKMYEMSLTHQVATQRILGKSPEFRDILHGPSLADVVNTDRYESGSDCNSDVPVDDSGLGRRLLALTMGGDRSRPGRRPSAGDDEEEEEEERRTSSEAASSRHSSASSRGSQSRRRDALSPHLPVGKYTRPGKPSPLTLDSILPECSVKEAKGLSSLWVNYGKFLPSVK